MNIISIKWALMMRFIESSILKIMQKGFVPILIVILLAALVGGYFAYTNSQTKTPAPNSQPSPTPVDANPEPSGAGETTNWKIYNGSGYSIKYPDSLGYSFSTESGVNGGEVNVDKFSTSDEKSAIRIYSYKEDFEPMVRILTDTNAEERIMVAGQLVPKITAKYQPLIHIGPLQNNSNLFKIVFVAASSSSTQKEDTNTFNQILSTFRFTE